MEPKKNKKVRSVIVVVIALIVLCMAIWFTVPHSSTKPFCFDFSRNMQFGDNRPIANPVNQGFVGPGGHIYYLPEVPALQAALKKQGFFIDPDESPNNGIYAGAYFGPTTETAVESFKSKYKLPQEHMGWVTDSMLDKLSALYRCPTSTPSSANATSSSK